MTSEIRLIPMNMTERARKLEPRLMCRTPRMIPDTMQPAPSDAKNSSSQRNVVTVMRQCRQQARLHTRCQQFFAPVMPPVHRRPPHGAAAATALPRRGVEIACGDQCVEMNGDDLIVMSLQ